MNINEVHWNFSDNGTKEPAKSRFWNFYILWTAWNFLMRFSLLCSGEWALSFYMCVNIYIGVSFNMRHMCPRNIKKICIMIRSGRWGKNWIMLQKRYASVFALYDIVNMVEIFGWHGNFMKSCSIRNDSHLIIYIIWKRMPPRNV